jgi:RNA polymerase sigma-70 factor (ECF subfamily)
METKFLDAYEQHADELFRFAFFRLGDQAAAEDAVADVFMKTWEQIATGEEIGHMRGFLFQALRNRIIDMRRKGSTLSLETVLEQDGERVAVDHTGVSSLIDSVEFSRICERMAELDEPYPTLLHLRYVEGLEPKEIGAMLGERVNTISVRITRGVEKLRKLIESQPANI